MIKHLLGEAEEWWLQSGYRGDASLLLRANPPIHSSHYQDVLWLQLSVQQGCGGDLSWTHMGRNVRTHWVITTKKTHTQPSRNVKYEEYKELNKETENGISDTDLNNHKYITVVSKPIMNWQHNDIRKKLFRKYTHTHTWAWIETELRGALQGVDEWGLAKVPRGIQISGIHKQHSGPCGGEGGMKGVRQKESSQLMERKKKKEKMNWVLNWMTELWGKYVYSSKEERLT